MSIDNLHDDMKKKTIGLDYHLNFNCPKSGTMHLSGTIYYQNYCTFTYMLENRNDPDNTPLFLLSCHAARGGGRVSGS